MGDNVIESPVFNNQFNSEDFNLGMTSTKALVLLLDQDIGSESEGDLQNEMLMVEIETALANNIRILPVLLPGIDIPREDSLTSETQSLLSFTFTQIRDDPEYANDIIRIIRFCRWHLAPHSGFIGTPLPGNIPSYAIGSVKSLVNTAEYIRQLIMALSSEEGQAQTLAEDQSQIDLALHVIRIWTDYLGLES